jgi:hypothetical protein
MSSWTCSRDSFVGPRLCSCDAFSGSSHIVPLRSRRFSNDCLTHFFELISHDMFFSGTQWLLFINQILHLTNPHDKLSIFVLYPSLRFPSIYRLTLWDLRLGHLSLVICRKEDLGWRTWALMILVFCLEWLRYEWFSISLFMDFDFPYCNVTSSLTL